MRDPYEKGGRRDAREDREARKDARNSSIHPLLQNSKQAATTIRILQTMITELGVRLAAQFLSDTVCDFHRYQPGQID
jgi:hypothetical protein